jgi:GT2 family glycosyltransferase
MIYQLAILLTSHNRKQKTLTCLKTIFEQEGIPDIHYTIYLVDDNSTDGTFETVRSTYPVVTIIKGNGQLFWAGGMRVAWTEALNDKKFDYYLLLNDDTFLNKDALKLLFADIKLVTDNAILIGSVKDPTTQEISYGGRRLKNNYNISSVILIPNCKSPQLCDLGNANIMLVPAQVVKQIGILSAKYTHAIADHEYTLKAKKAGIPTYISSFYNGLCTDDHDSYWTKNAYMPLKQRIKYLYSVKGLAYKQYLQFIRIHFPLYLPQAWLFLWLKTIFPFLFKNS